MQIKKKYIEVIYLVLKGTEGILSLAESRVRDNFLKSLGYETFVGERNKIYEHYCDKKEDGSPDVDDGSYHFQKQDLEVLNKELLTLLDEEVKVEAPESLKEIIEKTNYRPKTGEVEFIDEILALI